MVEKQEKNKGGAAASSMSNPGFGPGGMPAGLTM